MPDWCAGSSRDGTVAVQRIDGTGYAQSRNSGLVDPIAAGGRIVGGHIELTSVPDAERGTAHPGWRGLVWDVVTGRAGVVGGAYGTDGFWSPAARGTTAVALTEASFLDREHVILDLTALG